MLNKNKYIYLVNLSLVLNSAILLIPNKFKIYPIILFFIISFIYYKKSEIKIPFSFKKVLLISALLFIYLLTYFYSFQTKDAVFRLSTMSSLLAYPLIFGLLEASNFKLNSKQIKLIFVSFVIVTILFCVLSFCFFWNQKYTFSETIIHYSNLINISLGKFSIHPIYLSIYIGISLLMLVYLVNIKTNNYLKIVTGFGAIFLILILIVLMRKGPIIYLLIALFYLVKKYFKLTKTIFGVIVVALLMFLFLKIVPKYRNENRFEDLTENVLLEKPESSTAIRYKIYDCAIEKIIEKPIFGYGIGNVQNHLDPCYKSKNIDLSIKTYNCHNQFFSIILTAGFLGLILFLFTIYKIFKILKLNKSDIGISILLFFLLNFLTENVIERENGMLIYSFLLCFFLYQDSKSYKSL